MIYCLKIRSSVNVQDFDTLFEASICIDEFHLHSGKYIQGDQEKLYVFKKLWLKSGGVYYEAFISLLEMRDVKSYLNGSDYSDVGCNLPKDAVSLRPTTKSIFIS
ncbi:hypothetical protein B1H58_19310 [Pantoea alhagi]|uniref:Uncharacterized protein n=1 Tax=Pantoea alhagi TaxID=1891675 RepID=A0A1W6BA82_9GAMM|nr:hypothetical protein B1H58_19310 [Pantoea alhagi]